MKLNLGPKKNFSQRHIGISETALKEMLNVIGVNSLEHLINETVPKDIQLKDELNLDEGISEEQFLNQLKIIAKKNKLYKSFIGLGYYDCNTPTVILRNILENPSWYTSYTPYQAEISQGRLEALLNYQTMINDFTGMQISNASLLDEATAVAEAMTMSFRLRSRDLVKKNANVFFVSDKCFPQTIDVLKTRSEPLGIKLLIGDFKTLEFTDELDKLFGIAIQYPCGDGNVYDYTDLIKKAHDSNLLVTVVADLLSLAILTPPGEFGADIVVGSSQRFGLPMGYGGPHAGFFATKDEYKRQMPGRIIGVSIDSHGNKAYRLAVQVREQHIRREKATSNICTAQALLAIMSAMYAVYHGADGIRAIAEKTHSLTKVLDRELQKLGCTQENQYYFDTLKVAFDDVEKIRDIALQEKINFRYINETHVGISLDETTELEDIEKIVSIFANALEKGFYKIDLTEETEFNYPENLIRQSKYLTHPVFNSYHSETQMLRYLKTLQNKDISLADSMIPLGSCTMKLNATTEMIPITWPEFSKIHPFVSRDQAEGYTEVIKDLKKYLCEITGFSAVSFQPNAGAQGEFTGLMVIRAYHIDNGQAHRNITLIPSSAHGTNPASAAMAGMNVVVVNCDDKGNISLEDLKEKVEKYKDTLACMMVTYPSTHGVFEEDIKEISSIIHQNGGLLYLDGANMNAQVGLTSPATVNADVCHLNLHKTFGIPHGGGGPGVGPICVTKNLAKYLPSHPIIRSVGGEKAIHAVAAAPYSSASILLISYAYVKMLGKHGLKEATQYAILNANYIKSKLEKYYPVLYTGKFGRVAHEMILDLNVFKSSHILAEDVAKRLMDYGFHAPTMSFPVVGTLMVEPTESEPKEELDRFCNAMISIYNEIQEVAEGKADVHDNVLKNAPHTAFEIASDDWKHSYSREKAAYPLPSLKNNKFWVPVGRIDNSYGDKNLFCVCPPIEENK